MSLTAEQKVIRRQGIGSSDIAAIVGLSPFATPHDVYLSKVEGIDLEETFAMELGSLLEPAVLSLYERRAMPLALMRNPGTFIHPKLPFVVDSPDAEARFADGLRPVEAKTARFADFEAWGEEGTDAVPEHYVPQCIWHLGMARARWNDSTIVRCDVPVLIRTDEYRQYRVDWNEVLFGLLVEAAAKFWRDHVEKRVPPDPTGSKRAEEFIKARFPTDSGKKLQATDEDEQLVRELIAAEAVHDRNEQACEALKYRIQQRMGDAAELAGTFGRIVWKKQKDSTGTDWEAIALQLLDKVDADTRAKLFAQHQKVTRKGPRPFNKYFVK